MLANRLSEKVKQVLFIIKSLNCCELLRLILSRLYSVSNYYVMKVNLKTLNEYPLKRHPLGELSLLTQDDLLTIKKSIKNYDWPDTRDLLSRIQFYESGFHNCYVMKVNDKIAFIQWLIYPDENRIIKKNYRNIFYEVHDSQVIIENAFTFPEYRGYGYLSYVSRLLLNKAGEQGYKSAIGYVKYNNIISLNEFFRMGFKITESLREIKFFFTIRRNLKFKK